jgi:hypothetical protein
MTHFKKFEKIARALVKPTNNKRCHHFSFILLKKRLLTIGSNIQKTHPINLKNRKISARTGEDYSEFKNICSELNAINKLKKLTNINTKKCTLINIRYDRNMKIALAKPCMSCQNLLSVFTFKKVLWTNERGEYCE